MVFHPATDGVAWAVHSVDGKFGELRQGNGNNMWAFYQRPNQTRHLFRPMTMNDVFMKIAKIYLNEVAKSSAQRRQA